MPAAARLETFIAAVENGVHARAIDDCCTSDATTRENRAELRHGRRALVARETAVRERTADEHFFYDPAQRGPA